MSSNTKVSYGTTLNPKPLTLGAEGGGCNDVNRSPSKDPGGRSTLEGLKLVRQGNAKGVWVGSCPHFLAVYIIGVISRAIYNYIIHILQLLNEWGQYPKFGA